MPVLTKFNCFCRRVVVVFITPLINLFPNEEANRKASPVVKKKLLQILGSPIPNDDFFSLLLEQFFDVDISLISICYWSCINILTKNTPPKQNLLCK